jgi:hypothetical protein
MLKSTFFILAFALSFGAAQALTAAPPEGVEAWTIYKVPCSDGDVALGKEFCLAGLKLKGTVTPPPTGCALRPGYFDGCTGASVAAGQFPTLFADTGYSAHRPPWNVAGVDYGVGPAPFTPTKVPGTDTLPCGTVGAGPAFIVTVNNVTGPCVFDGWTFPSGGGISIIGTSSNITVKNSQFNNASFGMPTGTPHDNFLTNSAFVITDTSGQQIGVNSATAGNLTVTAVDFDGGGLLGKTSGSPNALYYHGAGLLTVQYSYFHNLPNDAIFYDGATGSQSFNIQFNVCYSQNYFPELLHSDCFQGSHGATAMAFKFNTMYVPAVTGTDAGGYNVPGLNNSVVNSNSQGAGNIAGLDVSNNTAIGVGTNHGQAGGQANANAFSRPFQINLTNCNGCTGNMVSPVASNNYIGATMFSAFYPQASSPLPSPNPMTGGVATSGSPTITGLTSTNSVFQSSQVACSVCPAGSRVLTVNSSSSITLDHNASGSATGVAVTVSGTGSVTSPTFSNNIDMSTGSTIAAPY